MSQLTHRLNIKLCSTENCEVEMPIEAYLELHETHLVYAGKRWVKELDEQINTKVPKYRQWYKKIKRSAIAFITVERSDEDDTWDVCLLAGGLLEVITVETEAEAQDLFSKLDAWWTAFLVSSPCS